MGIVEAYKERLKQSTLEEGLKKGREEGRKGRRNCRSTSQFCKKGSYIDKIGQTAEKIFVTLFHSAKALNFKT